MKFSEAVLLVEKNTLNEGDINSDKFSAFWFVKGRVLELKNVSYDDGDFYHADLVEKNSAIFGLNPNKVEELASTDAYGQDKIVEMAMRKGAIRGRDFDNGTLHIEFYPVGRKNALNFLLDTSNKKLHKKFLIDEYTKGGVVSKAFSSVKEAVNYLTN